MLQVDDSIQILRPANMPKNAIKRKPYKTDLKNNIARKQCDGRIMKAFCAMRSARGRDAVTLMIEYGSITTDDIRTLLREVHPPRTAGDIKDSGIPLERHSVPKIISGRQSTIALYQIGSPDLVNPRKFGGRKNVPGWVKKKLIELHGSHCAICAETERSGPLTVDHRVPYKVGGNYLISDENKQVDSGFHLLCQSCQLVKAKACNNCGNETDFERCGTCYWASPSDYRHIALKEVRRLELTLSGSEILQYDLILKECCNDVKILIAAVRRFLLSNIFANYVHSGSIPVAGTHSQPTCRIEVREDVSMCAKNGS